MTLSAGRQGRAWAASGPWLSTSSLPAAGMSLQHPWVPAQTELEQPSCSMSSGDLPDADLVSAGR